MGLSHSAVSRRIAITRKKMALEQDFEKQVKAIKSQINGLLPKSIFCERKLR
jgi:hypothetical protein